MISVLVTRAIENNPQLIGLEDVVEKEIVHHELLYILHKEGLLEHLTFIGGTALHLCHGSNRLSEDLDFTGGAHFSTKDFSSLSADIESNLQNKFMLDVSVREPVIDRGDTSTWKVTIVKNPKRPDLSSQKMQIDICRYDSFDKVRRPAKNFYEVTSLVEGLPIPVQSAKEILADKLITLAFRERRIKPRDVWDLTWLNQKNVPIEASLVKKKLEMRGKTQDEFLDSLEIHRGFILASHETKSDFEREMSRFVPKGIRERTLNRKEFWPYVGATITSQIDAIESALTRGNKERHDWDMSM
ncbi:nucleotidyl transferase AbiEii/AbiGii toxin family protein [Salinimonas sp. HHU 13199]|uniref:Nucleotidyl transferase AbiEii/AbiGii toxin family protein n=1 Tax=Salinimonas profundi TaxID=2729140 RepID=A0ABR8LCS3_9ALTE|nr:nucleotidyl transferase AbiEii/AbiGii toxin family protein [Salinimonas profundi]MBD3584129.1 nucleotidyl transferase AbiEii/AbiGii toxin family protein [Salinimonas profundi]